MSVHDCGHSSCETCSRSPSSTPPDKILISALQLHATVGPDRWLKARAQPITLTLALSAHLARAARTDDVTASVHYGELCKDLRARAHGATFPDLRALAECAAALALAKPGALAVTVEAEAANQFLLAESAGVSVRRRKAGLADGADGALTARDEDRAYIRDLRLNVIIGVNPPEREFKQIVVTNVSFAAPGWVSPDWHKMHGALVEAIEASSYLTLEAFVTNVARIACFFEGADTVTVKAQKPSALVYAGSSGVEITRSRAFFQEA